MYDYYTYKHGSLWFVCVMSQSGASVVDCIVNGSESSQVVIQMSHNSGHKNNVLNDVRLPFIASLYFNINVVNIDFYPS